MTKKIEILIKCDTKEQAADALEIVSWLIRHGGFDLAPSDIQELEDENRNKFGFRYEVSNNVENTDIYDNIK